MAESTATARHPHLYSVFGVSIIRWKLYIYDAEDSFRGTERVTLYQQSAFYSREAAIRHALAIHSTLPADITRLEIHIERYQEGDHAKEGQ